MAKGIKSHLHNIWATASIRMHRFWANQSYQIAKQAGFIRAHNQEGVSTMSKSKKPKRLPEGRKKLNAKRARAKGWRVVEAKKPAK